MGSVLQRTMNAAATWDETGAGVDEAVLIKLVLAIEGMGIRVHDARSGDL